MATETDQYVVVDLTANNAHCYPDAKTPPDLGWGVCRQNHGLQAFGDGYMNEKVATARAAALNAGLPGSSIVNDSEPPCDCSTAHPGILWPWAPDSDDSLPFVERCDDCQLYASDDAAADALAKAIGSRVMWADLHKEPERLHPFVLSPEASRAMNNGPLTAEEYALVEEGLNYTEEHGAPGMVPAMRPHTERHAALAEAITRKLGKD